MSARTSPRLAAASVSVLVAAALTPVALASATASAAPAPTSASVTGAPALWTPVAGRTTLARPSAETVAGTSTLVRLSPSLMPRRAAGQAVGFDVGRRAPLTGQVSHLERGPGYTAWTGTLASEAGDFSVVRAGSTYRASIYAEDGTWTVTRAQGDLYWLTHVAAFAGQPEDSTRSDAVGGAAPRAQARATERATTLARRAQAGKKRKGKVKIDVLFAYTKSAKAAAGGTKDGIKAAVGQAAADTNTSLRNSGLRIAIKVKGIVRTQGNEKGGVFKTLNEIQALHDGDFDSATRARARRHADLVHVFTGGDSNADFCGAGTVSYRPSTTGPNLGQSTSFISCLPYLVATHEIGHNLGADHDVYPGVGQVSKVPYAHGYVDIAHRFVTVMGYPNACFDAGAYDCSRIPFFSSASNTYNGFALGDRKANNVKVIKQTAPRVAHYR